MLCDTSKDKIAKNEIEIIPSSLKAVNTKTEVKKLGKAASAQRLSGSQVAEADRLRVQCGRLCASLFFDERTAVRSLGFTSAIDGEGKSFLARLAALVMARD